MSTGSALWFIMTVGGSILLAIALAYGLISTRRRRENPVAQRVTEAGTRQVYRQEEDRRQQQEGGDAAIVPEHTDGQGISVTEARQAVSGHNANIVLRVSLILAAIAGVGLAYFWRRL